MIVVFGMIDRALDIVGLCTVIYWSIKAGKYFTRKFG
jgi:hypothetical protein